MVTLRPADESDSRSLWEWRNHADSRAASLDTALVPWADHERWYASSLSNPDRVILIAVDEQSARLGMVRFDLEHDGPSTVSINIAPEWRGRGLGYPILHLAVQQVREKQADAAFIAQIRSSNEPSIRIFEREGFARVSEADGVVTLRA